MRFSKKKLMFMLAMSTLAASISGCSKSNNAQSGKDTEVKTEGSASNTESSQNVTFTAGTYSSTKSGNNGDVTVEVTFTDSKIDSVIVKNHQETAGLGDTAMDKLSNSIVTGQTLNIDAISGATNSCNALINAVEDCVIQAGGNVEALKAVSTVTESPVPAGEKVEVSADYIVIGAGPSGLASAIEAAKAGLNVVVFEKTGATGGCAKYGMGPLALETAIMAEEGETLTVDEAYNMFMEYTHYRVDGVLVRKYFELSNNTIEWLQDMGVKFQEAARYFDKSYATWHIVESDEGKVGGGQAATMTRKMTETAEALGVQIYLNSPVSEIVTKEGKVTGVVATNTEDGTRYEATGNAVLVATGGFGNNVEMLESELNYKWGEDYFGMQFPGHEGDGIAMAEQAGGAKSDVNIEMIFNIYANGGPNITQDVMVMMRQPGVLVNQEGIRFFNEEQVQNTTYCGNSLVQQTGNTGYMILSQSMVDHYLENGVDFTSKVYHVDDMHTFDSSVTSLMEGNSPSVMKADTLEEVAKFFNIDEAALVKTMDEYNGYCKTGVDPLGKSKEFLHSFENGPYYVAQYFPGSYGTLGGVAINSNLEVVDEKNVAIPGLYSAGTDSCTVFGDSYMFLLPGNTMGYSLNSGRLAAQSVIEYLNK